MELLKKEDVKRLSEKQDGWHVSIYLPTHRAGPETQQNPVRLKNLLAESEERLTAAGLRPPEAKALLEPAAKLVQDSLFWQQQSDGLAIFLSPEITRHYRLPFDFEALVVVADRFHIKPLLPLLSGDGRFYVLAVSQAKVRLLQGSRYSVGEIELEGLPTSLAEALRFDDPERRLQFHTASGPTGGEGSRPAMFHGQGAPSHNEKDAILRYFHELDTGVREWLAGQHAPLVLAGVDYLLPLYQEANEYPHLMEQGIEGNPDNLSAEELHRQAWAIVQPRFVKDREAAAGRYAQWADSDRASDDLAEIVPAATYGRIETLFVARDLQHWGAFDSTTNEVRTHEDAEPGDQDLLDLAAVQTLLNGGTVYAAALEDMPTQTSVAALFRY